MPTGLLRAFLLLGLMIGLCPALAVPSALAQIDPDVRERVLSAVMSIAVIVDVDEDGQASTQWVPVGSGTVVAPDGLILTNWHVVDMAEHRSELDRWEAEAADDGEALTFDLIDDELLILQTEGVGEPVPVYRAEVVAEQHALDLAVLRITSDADGVPVADEDLNLPFVPVGASRDVRQGDPVHVFGYPAIGGGTLQYTTGVVSGFGFDPDLDGAVWITTDASVSGGSSGGAAVDAAGALIGVPTQGGQLDCRPGDTNGDGDITADDVGCIPTGGSIGQLRPIDLAKPMLSRAGLTLEATDTDDQQEIIAAAVDPTSTPEPTSTPPPAPTLPPQPSPTPATDEAVAMSSDVPMYRGNTQRTGEMPGPAPEGVLGVLWEVDLGYGMYGQPALVDGVLYVAAGNEWEKGGIAAAFDAETGKELWRKTHAETWSSPLISKGKLYYTDLDGRILSLRVDDGVLTDVASVASNDYQCPTGSSPAIADGLIIASFGCFGPEDTGETTEWSDLDGMLVAFEAETLAERWRFEYSGFAPTLSPASADGIVFIADVQGDYTEGSVYAVSVKSGQELWRFSAAGGFVSTPLISEDIVIALSTENTVYAFDVVSGMERWRYQLDASPGPWPGLSHGYLYIGDEAGGIVALDAATGQVSNELPGARSASEIATNLGDLYFGGECGYLYRIDTTTNDRDSFNTKAGCSQVGAPIIANGAVYIGTEYGELRALGDLRRKVPITLGITALIADQPAIIRAAPSNAAVIRGEAAVGTIAKVTGPSEERQGEVWWPVDVENIGTGWVLESALIAAQVPPTPTPVPPPTATPRATSTPLPTSTPVPTAVPVEPDRDISAQNLPLLDLLPTQEQVPGGLVLADEAERSKQDVVAALGGTDESVQLLDDWGWSGNAFRDYLLPQDAKPGPSGTTFLNVSVHRFADAESAANALIFFSDQVVISQGLEDVEAPAIGESARLLIGAPDGVPLTILYVQDGRIHYRIGGSSASSDGDPTADVLAVAQAIIPPADTTARWCQDPDYPAHNSFVETRGVAVIREEPSPYAATVTTLPAGERLFVRSDQRVRPDLVGDIGCEWVPIIIHESEREGFISIDHVTITP